MQFSIVGDPSGDFRGQNDEQTPFQILRSHRLPIQPAPSTLFTVRLQAAEAVLTRMHEGKPALVVSPSCTTLIAAFDGGYHFRRLRTSGERYTEEPEKDGYSDPADAAMYMFLGGGEGRLLLSGSPERPKPVNTSRPYNPFEKKAAGVRW